MQVFEIPPKPERPPRQNSRPGQGPKADARNAVRPGPHKQAAKQPDSKEENKSRGTGRVQNVPGTVRKNTADTASPPSVSGGKRPKGRKEKTPPSPSAPAPAPSRPETASPVRWRPAQSRRTAPGTRTRHYEKTASHPAFPVPFSRCTAGFPAQGRKEINPVCVGKNSLY